MSRYSIKDLEQITGIKAHTIRIWERRYAIIEPQRTETNIRYYSDQDLRRLLNISMLNASGIKISTLAEMKSIDIETKVLEVSKMMDIKNTSIDKLILASINFDENLFESVLNKCILEKGMENTTIQILFPFFQRIGILWQVGTISPAQEHFISNLIRQKLFTAIDSVSGPRHNSSKKIVFFLKQGELHEVSILFYNYIAKKNGAKTLYLGQDLPLTDLKNVVEEYKPDYLFTSFISPISLSDLSGYLRSLATEFNEIKLFVTGSQLKQENLSIPNNFKLVSNISDFRSILK
ncbi:MerR family transcriptional regulator [Labilibaculum sp.]|uniref:MerR family transcriptional regulator n=1 Tax=Labilibaculum sp. TaxID=2060723 RepID=UPI0035645D47